MAPAMKKPRAGWKRMGHKGSQTSMREEVSKAAFSAKPATNQPSMKMMKKKSATSIFSTTLPNKLPSPSLCFSVCVCWSRLSFCFFNSWFCSSRLSSLLIISCSTRKDGSFKKNVSGSSFSSSLPLSSWNCCSRSSFRHSFSPETDGRGSFWRGKRSPSRSSFLLLASLVSLAGRKGERRGGEFHGVGRWSRRRRRDGDGDGVWRRRRAGGEEEEEEGIVALITTTMDEMRKQEGGSFFFFFFFFSAPENGFVCLDRS